MWIHFGYLNLKIFQCLKRFQFGQVWSPKPCCKYSWHYEIKKLSNWLGMLGFIFSSTIVFTVNLWLVEQQLFICHLPTESFSSSSPPIFHPRTCTFMVRGDMMFKPIVGQLKAFLGTKGLSKGLIGLLIHLFN